MDAGPEAAPPAVRRFGPRPRRWDKVCHGCCSRRLARFGDGRAQRRWSDSAFWHRCGALVRRHQSVGRSRSRPRDLMSVWSGSTVLRLYAPRLTPDFLTGARVRPDALLPRSDPPSSEASGIASRRRFHGNNKASCSSLRMAEMRRFVSETGNFRSGVASWPTEPISSKGKAAFRAVSRARRRTSLWI